MVPDVAAVADPNTGYEIYYRGSPEIVGGTSAVAPLYAGLLAAAGRKLGFISDKLWQRREDFVDVTQGDNGMYHAQIGPDPCTGLGVPVGTKLEAWLSGRSSPVPTPPPHRTVRLAEAIDWATSALPQHTPLGLHMIQQYVEEGLRAHWPKEPTTVSLACALDWGTTDLPLATLTSHAARQFIVRGLTKHWPKDLP
jgi:hypothetical protein